MKHGTWYLLLAFGLIALAGCGGGSPTGQAAEGDVALIAYDSAGAYGWAGRMYAVHLQNLLGHFGGRVRIIPVEEYRSSELAQCDSVFYIGNVYDNPLPPALLDDVLATEKPVCWIGYNIWQLADRDPEQFADKLGLTFVELDDAPASAINITYKGRQLQQSPLDPDVGVCRIDDATRAEEIAACTKNGSTFPYITRSGHFWYVASNPLINVGYADRYLALADSLHDILNAPHATAHLAFVRIEDVTAVSDPDQLRLLADTLAAARVPFGVCVVPEYRDPRNVYGLGDVVALADSPEVVAALQYMAARGGQIIQHGYTHQHDNALNPYTGSSADDYEFFNVSLDGAGDEIYEGPVTEDSFTWADDRVRQGAVALGMAGLRPVAWNTPHYLASEVDYAAFRNAYRYSVDRGLYFVPYPGGQAPAGMQGHTPGFRSGTSYTQYFMQQMAPYPLRDVYGIDRIPETIGYIDPLGFGETDPALPADLIARAGANLVVRDGWAGCYFHWYLDAAYLADLVQSLQAQGYSFTGIPL